MDQNRWQKIENLYFKALETSRENRTEFLKLETAGDEELLKEVLSLLNSHEQSDDFLSEPEFSLGLELLAEPNHVFKPDQEFGNYTILKFLGRGGMGEVYQARDTRLGRIVALKVLPEDVATNQERIRRFINEARAASALNHPNILTIHEISEANNRQYIASEFVEGENLRQRLKRFPFPDLREILEISSQIAAALNAAHRAGIVHRDIKPENIMLREDGLVKVLDFGLAKLTENLDDTNSGNFPFATNPGLILGTIAYMSPEQVRGKKIDARSDIWSFGVILYEMLTGKAPFEGDSTSDIIAAILTSEPIIPAENPTENFTELWQLMLKALRKNPEERYQSAIEMSTDLKGILLDSLNGSFQRDYKTAANTSGSKLASGNGVSQLNSNQLVTSSFQLNGGRPFFWLIVSLIAVSVTAFAVYHFSNKPRGFKNSMKITRISDTGKTSQASISPDGKYLAHVITEPGQSSLWVKHIATNSSVQLVQPAPVEYFPLTFSPDGNYIFYSTKPKESPGTLYQIPVLGGEPKKIIENVASPISFAPDAEKFAFVRNNGGETLLMIANIHGQEERQLSSRRRPDYISSNPAWSPNGKFIACAAGSASGERVSRILLFSVEDNSESQLSNHKWRFIDRLQWLSDGSGLVAPAMETTGPETAQIWFFPFPEGEAQRITNDLNDYAGISLTADFNSLVTMQMEMHRNIWLLSNIESGEAHSLTEKIPDNYRFVSWTPDKKVVYPSPLSGNRDIWIMNSDGGNRKQLTSTPHNDILPDASPDNKFIAFGSNRSPAGTVNIWRINIDGTNPVQLTNGKDESFPKFTPDGKWIFYVSGANDSPAEQRTIWKVPSEGGEPIQVITNPSFGMDISPDGKQIACWYKDNKSAPWKVAIIPIEGGEPIKLLDVSQNSQIRWKPDGTAITYIRTENGVSNIWSQPISGDPSKQLTKFTSEQIFQFDWSEDNQLVLSRGMTTRSAIMISSIR